MPYIRPSVLSATPLLIKQIAAETAALVGEGASILSLAQGTPNLPLFAPAVDAMTELVQSAKLPYTDVNGLAAVRSVAAEFVKAYYPLPAHAEPLDADHVLITTGAAQSVYNCLALSVGGPSDVVLSPLPAYGLYLHQTNILNGTFDTIETSMENDFKPTIENLEAAFKKHTKTESVRSRERIGVCKRAPLTEQALIIVVLLFCSSLAQPANPCAPSVASYCASRTIPSVRP
jgi:aspartate/methionine/tyrosine aminotransferase